MRTRFVVVAVMLTVGASLLVTTAFGGSAVATKGGTLRVNRSLSDYEYLDPQKCYDTTCAETLWPTSYNLLQYPEKNGPEGKRVYPEAATGFPVVSKNGKTYTFTVRKGHKASNGKTVTPAWFVHAFERLLNPKMGEAAAARFGGIAIMKVVIGAQAYYDGKASKIAGLVVDGDKLVIRMNKPFPSITSALAMPWFTATDPALPYSDEGLSTIPGAGPYYVSAREIGRSVVLDRNKLYKGKRPANADRIVIAVNGDENQSLLQVKAGQADYDQNLIPSVAAAELGDQFGVNKSRFFVKPTTSTTYWGLNTLPGSPLASLKLRKAVNWAIDRPAQVRTSGKYGGRRTSQILPPGLPGFIRADKMYAYAGASIARAKQVAGDVSAVPELRILHSNRPSNINRAQIMRYNLEQIGLKARTESVPSSQLLSRAGNKKAGNYDLVLVGFQADYPDPQNFINLLLDGREVPDEGGSNNVAFFNSPKFNALMDKAAQLRGDARFAFYGNLDLQIMKEAAPWAPIVNSNSRLFVSARISNFTFNDATTFVALNALDIK